MGGATGLTTAPNISSVRLWASQAPSIALSVLVIAMPPATVEAFTGLKRAARVLRLVVEVKTSK
jgi:hypothetical protein